MRYSLFVFGILFATFSAQAQSPLKSLEDLSSEIKQSDISWLSKFDCQRSLKKQISIIQDRPDRAKQVLKDYAARNQHCLRLVKDSKINTLKDKVNGLKRLRRELEAENQNTDLLNQAIKQAQDRLELFQLQ